jgi:hypothetical protein
MIPAAMPVAIEEPTKLRRSILFLADFDMTMNSKVMVEGG